MPNPKEVTFYFENEQETCDLMGQHNPICTIDSFNTLFYTFLSYYVSKYDSSQSVPELEKNIRPYFFEGYIASASQSSRMYRKAIIDTLMDIEAGKITVTEFLDSVGRNERNDTNEDGMF